MVVMKFGGTSVQDASALKRVAEIVSAQAAQSSVVVVLSATAGTTNELLALAQACVLPSTNIADRCDALHTRHRLVITELITDEHHARAANQQLDATMQVLRRLCTAMQVLEECTPQSLDAVAAIGERLSTSIFVHALRAVGVTVAEVMATELIRTDSTFQRATVDMAVTSQLCRAELLPRLASKTVVVTQGFAGSDALGNTTTLGRGGSDASAAIIGAAIQAERIEIWTDVSGVYSADPRLIASARPIPELTFGEVRELALYGAKVIHPDTIIPAVEANIPVVIRNTFAPSDVGTTIRTHSTNHADVHAVSLMRPCIMLSGPRADVRNVLAHDAMMQQLLLSASSVEHAMAVLFTPTREIGTDVRVATVELNLELQNVGVIVLIGSAVQEMSTLHKITLALKQHAPLATLHGVSPHSLFVVAPLENATACLTALHELTH